MGELFFIFWFFISLLIIERRRGCPVPSGGRAEEGAAASARPLGRARGAARGFLFYFIHLCRALGPHSALSGCAPGPGCQPGRVQYLQAMAHLKYFLSSRRASLSSGEAPPSPPAWSGPRAAAAVPVTAGCAAPHTHGPQTGCSPQPSLACRVPCKAQLPLCVFPLF